MAHRDKRHKSGLGGGTAGSGSGSGMATELCLSISIPILAPSPFLSFAPQMHPFLLPTNPSILLSLSLAVLPLIRLSSAAQPVYQPVSQPSLQAIANLSDPLPLLDFHNPHSLLARILIPRPVGSHNLSLCRSLFEHHFRSLSTTIQLPPTALFFSNALQPPSYSPTPLSHIQTWQLESHSFTDQTPYGQKTFTSQIFTHDPTAPLRVVIAAHIDSKFFPNPPEDQFVGATDSAAPVAIILEVAKALTPLLDKKLAAQAALGDAKMTAERVTLQVLLLDGEEAFKDWSATDSIYGARALVKKWTEPLRTPTAVMKHARSIDAIQTFILFDLLGAQQPTVRSYFRETGWLFDAWMRAEQRLASGGLFASTARAAAQARAPFFVPQKSWASYGMIEDDHIPFLREGVPILHLIASPFPSVWHNLGDDKSALDLDVILEWSLITQVGLVEYLGLERFIDGFVDRNRDKRDEL